MWRPGQETWSSVGAFLSAFAAVVVVSFADGGYFPETWAWTAIAFASLAGVVLLVRDRIELGRLELVAIGGLTALVAWTTLSTLWSSAPSDSLDEARRGLVYLAALLAFMLLAEPRTVSALLGGCATGVAVVAAYSLGARLFPDEPLQRDPVEGTLLIDPLGYANALGILSAIGVLLAVEFAVHGATRSVRALGAAAPMVLLPTLVLTSSRGAWLALGVGACAWALLESRRARLLATALLLVPPAGIVISLTASASVLGDEGATVEDISEAGVRIALAIVCLAAVSAAATLVVPRVERAFRRQRSFRVGPVVIASALACIVVLVALGPAPTLGPRGEYWRIAWSQYQEDPLLGTGAGTFALYSRAGGLFQQPLDAHSLYLEAFAELGPIGLVLLGAVLGPPLLSAVRARRDLFVGGAAGGYVAYLVHAGLDWDWEVPAVTLTALVAAAVLLGANRSRENPLVVGPRARTGLLLATFMLAALALTAQLAAG